MFVFESVGQSVLEYGSLFRFDCFSVSEPSNLPLSREACLLVCLLHRTT